MSTLALMDPKDIPDALKARGLKQVALARHLGLDPSSLTKTINGQRQLKASELREIEAFFASPEGGDVEGIGPRRAGGQRRIPVYGYAMAGQLDAIAFNSGQVVDWIDPPPLWNGTGDLFAIRVLGDSMEPRLFAGELVVAQLGLPPARERDCVVEMTDGSALVKTYRGLKDGQLHVEQWNPPKMLSVPATKVRAMHAVIWRR